MNESSLEKLATGAVGAVVCAAEMAGLSAPAGLLEAAAASIGIGGHLRKRNPADAEAAIAAVLEAMSTEWRAWSAGSASAGRTAGAIESAIKSVEEVASHCLPTPTEIVAGGRNAEAAANIMLSHAASRGGDRFADRADAALARDLLHRVAKRGFGRLFETPAFIEALAPAMREATLAHLETLREEIEGATASLGRIETQVEAGFAEMRAEFAMVRRLLEAREGTAVDADRRERQIANLVQEILRQDAPQDRAEEMVDEAIAEVRAMRDRLSTRPNTLSPARAEARERAEEALAVFDFDAADRAFREFRALGREERKESRRESLRTDAEETVEIAEVANARGDLLEAADLYEEAAETVDAVDWELKWRYWAQVSSLLSDYGHRHASAQSFERALWAYREKCLPLVPMDERPQQWAATRNDIAEVLRKQGDCFDDEEAELLALEYYEAALEVIDPKKNAEAFGCAKLNMGATLSSLSRRGDTFSRTMDALGLFRAAADVFTREDEPESWAMVQNNIGATEFHLGNFAEDPKAFKRSIAAYEEALKVFTADDHPEDFVTASNNLAGSLNQLARIEDNAEMYTRALQVLEKAAELLNRPTDPIRWARLRHCFGIVARNTALKTDDVPLMERAAESFDDALSVYSADTNARRYAESLGYQGAALANLALVREDEPLADQAAQQLREAAQRLEALSGSDDDVRRFLAMLEGLAEIGTDAN